MVQPIDSNFPGKEWSGGDAILYNAHAYSYDSDIRLADDGHVRYKWYSNHSADIIIVEGDFSMRTEPETGNPNPSNSRVKVGSSLFSCMAILVQFYLATYRCAEANHATAAWCHLVLTRGVSTAFLGHDLLLLP